jgi:hypothetical protein
MYSLSHLLPFLHIEVYLITPAIEGGDMTGQNGGGRGNGKQMFQFIDLALQTISRNLGIICRLKEINF